MVPCCEITIGKLKFTSLAGLEIKKSWKTFTDTAKIAIPKSIYYRDDSGNLKPVKHIGEFIKTGDKVEIKLGYNTQLFTEFTGYIAYSPRVTIPYELECEDEMYQLKKKTVNVSIQNATVRQIIEAAAPGYELVCIDELYGDFSMKNTTPVKIFNELQEKAGLYTFFRGKHLVCGKVYLDENISRRIADFEHGVNIISHDLQYVKSEDVRFKAIGISYQRNGEVIRAEIGEDGGNIETWRLTNYVDEKHLKQLLQQRYDRSKQHYGYKGSITSFGWPIVEHGQIVRIIDKMYENRESMHFVDNVEIFVFPSGGYRRTIEVCREYVEADKPLN